MAVYLDDFDTGAASALGSLWTSGGGYAVSADGYAYTVDTRNPAAVFATAPSGADQFVERKFANNNGVSFGVITRATLSGNSVQRGYLARHNGSGIAIFRAVGGNFTQLAQGSHTRASGQTMRMESIGNQHTVYMDGVQIVTVTDSNYPSGGSVGMRDGGTADSRIESMRGGDYGLSYSGTLSLSGSGTVTASGSPATVAVLPFLGSGDTSASGSPSVASGLPLSGSGSSSSGAVPSASGSLSAFGSGSSSSTGKPAVAASLPVSGVGTSTFTGAGTIRADGRLDLSGTGQLRRSGSPAVAGAAALSSSGSTTPTGSPRFGGALYLDTDGQLVLIGVGEQVPVGFTPYVVPVDVEDGSTAYAPVSGRYITEVFL